MYRLLGLFCLTACTKEPPMRGQTVYRAMCISCHNVNPHLDGSIGPAVASASRILLDARILYATYPPGYKPKRETHMMPKMPAVAPEIDALAEYLGSLKQQP